MRQVKVEIDYDVIIFKAKVDELFVEDFRLDIPIEEFCKLIENIIIVLETDKCNICDEIGASPIEVSLDKDKSLVVKVFEKTSPIKVYKYDRAILNVSLKQYFHSILTEIENLLWR